MTNFAAIDFESAIRLAVSLGGDSDTLACITGGLAEAYYKEIPEEIAHQMWSRLPDDFHRILREMERTWGYPLAGRVGENSWKVLERREESCNFAAEKSNCIIIKKREL